MSKAEIDYLFLASDVRSGSTYVSELIAYSLEEFADFQLFDITQEKLSYLDDAATPAEVYTTLTSLWTNPNGIRSTKVMCAALSVVVRSARRDQQLAELAFGPRARWIVVRRRDRIAQAVSLAYARRSGRYHDYAENRIEGDDRPTMAEIRDALLAINLSDDYLNLFKSVPSTATELFYEDVLADPQNSIANALEEVGLVERNSGLSVAQAKLVPTDGESKRRSQAEFEHWLLENNHRTDDV